MRQPSGHFFRSIAASFVVVVTLLLPRSAHARQMPHYDLDSLAFESDAIVGATKISERKVDEYTTVTTLRATHPYWSRAGDLPKGTTFEVEYSLYSFGPPWGYDSRERAPEVDPEMVFFLAHPKERPGQIVDPHAWYVVSSGMRIFIDGRLHRFVQMNNPGGFDAVPGEHPPGSKTPYDREGFDAAISRSILRASQARFTIADPPSYGRTVTLVAHSHDPYARDGSEDLIGAALIVALGKANELDALLDARANAQRVRGFGLQHGIAVERLVDAAGHATTLDRRLAALALLEGMGFELGAKQELGPQLAKLLDDPEVSIRRAALALWFSDRMTPKALSDAIVARFAVEKDPSLRITLYLRALELGRGRDLNIEGVEWPLIAAAARAPEGEDPSLVVEWTNVDAPERYAERVLVELRDGDRLVHREDLFRRGLGSRSGGDRTHATYPLTFEAPVETREYDLTIELTLRRRGPGDTIERVQRRIHVGAAKVARLSEPSVASHGSAELARTSTIERALERAAGWADPRRVGLVAIGVVVLIAGGVVVGRRRRRSS